MKKVLALILSLSLVASLTMPCAFAATTLPTICSLHDFSVRFSVASFIYNTDHEFLSENMESNTGAVKNSITTYFPSANSYVTIYMPVGVADVCEISVHNYLNNSTMESMNMLLLLYEIVMAAGNFDTALEVSDCMDKLGMLDNFDVGKDGSLDYHGLHLYWAMTDFMGFVFSVSPER